LAFWDRKKVCITGGAGFVGSHLTEILLHDGADVTVAERPGPASFSRIEAIKSEVRLIEADLSTAEGARQVTEGQEVVLNLAGKVASIQYNRHHHAEMFTANMRLANEVMEAAAANGVERFLVVSSACIYPFDAAVPTTEDQGDWGKPEPPNEGYGWAKRMAEHLGRYYDAESAMSVAVCRPFNMYGPGDHWDEEVSHVIPALIKRVMDGEDPVIVWGSGNQTRAFLHVRDGAMGMKLIAEKAQTPDPINVGNDQEVSIGRLAEMILEATGSSATLKFDTSKPDGYPRRSADVRRLRQVTGWLPQIPFEQRLQEMVQEYEAIRVAG